MTLAIRIHCIALSLAVAFALPPVRSLSAAAAQDEGRSGRLLSAIQASSDVAWLERIALSPAFAAQAGGQLEGAARTGEFRRFAYIQLGAIGSAASLGAITAIEKSVRTRLVATPTVNIDEWPREQNRNGRGLAESVGPDGRTYRVVFWNLQGRYDLFLKSSLTPSDHASWSRPQPVGTDVDWPPPSVTLTWKGRDTVFLRYMPNKKGARRQLRIISLPALRKDSDGDGWTDAEEQSLGLDPNLADSDHDGIPDGADTCPLWSQPLPSDPYAIAIWRSFLAQYAFSRHRQPLWVTSKPVAVSGYGAPVLFGYVEPTRRAFEQRGATYVSWTADRYGSELWVEMSESQNPRSGSGVTYVVKQVQGQWVVTGLRRFWYS